MTLPRWITQAGTYGASAAAPYGGYQQQQPSAYSNQVSEAFCCVCNVPFCPTDITLELGEFAAMCK